MSASLQPSRKLPPTERDFDIYEAVHIAGYPTREQAQKYDISQTRVRQIVRRVIEWLGEVIPPQAKVAKEQQSHLARQIAADRFNLQYAEASTNWYQSGELNFAGLRIRITHAHARLGLPGSLIGGLAADAIEGLEVPAYVPPAEPVSSRHTPCAVDDELASVGRGSPNPVGRGSPNPVGRGSPDPAPAPTEGLPNETDDPEPTAATMGLDLAKFIYQFRHILIPPPHRPNELQEAKQVLLAAGYQLPDDEEKQFVAANIENPPVRDFSAEGCVESAPADETHDSPSETHTDAPTCDGSIHNQNPSERANNTPSQPLLTTPAQQPVIELQVSPHRPGAPFSQPGNCFEAPTQPVPCSPSPVSCDPNPEPSARTD